MQCVNTTVCVILIVTILVTILADAYHQHYHQYYDCANKVTDNTNHRCCTAISIIWSLITQSTVQTYMTHPTPDWGRHLDKRLPLAQTLHSHCQSQLLDQTCAAQTLGWTLRTKRTTSHSHNTINNVTKLFHTQIFLFIELSWQLMEDLKISADLNCVTYAVICIYFNVCKK